MKVPSGMHVNYEYELWWAKQVVESNPEACILDYGCGAGAVVVEGRRRGLAMFGTDIFYKGAAVRAKAEKTGLVGNAIQEILDGRIGFGDASFDLVLSNQVFEHVEDLDATLAEIWRVMKPGGTLLALFPTRDIWREGHIGIPFTHWFKPGSNLRYAYTVALRTLGFGRYKAKLGMRQWAKEKLDWVDNYCYYRSMDTIARIFSKYYDYESISIDYVQYRLQAANPWMRRIGSFVLSLPGGKDLTSTMYRKLGGLVLLAKWKCRI
jgi:SAM-dependent methyltransferase